jgi:hypothetical protein
MSNVLPNKNAQDTTATPEDLLRILGELDADVIAEIFALHPTVTDLEVAAMVLAGDVDILGKTGRSQTGIIAEIVDILAEDDEEEPRRT